MRIYRLIITERMNSGYRDFAGGDYEHDESSQERVVLNEIYADVELLKEQLANIKELKLTFHRVFEKPRMFAISLPVEEILSKKRHSEYVVDEFVDNSDDEYMIEDYSWFRHYFDILIEEYTVRETLVDASTIK